MNWDQIAGKWKQYQGSIRQQWGKLTDDDLQVAQGSQDKLVGLIQERYGITKEAAHEQLEKFLSAQGGQQTRTTGGI